MILTVRQLLKNLRKGDRQKNFSITDDEYLLLREDYATSVGIFTEQWYNPRTIEVPYVDFRDFYLKRTLNKRMASGEIQFRDDEREDK